MKKRIFLLLGTNLGDRKKNLTEARNAIELQVGSIIRASSIYETKAWGKTDQPDFLNQALEVETRFSPTRVLQEILAIEESLGRTRKEKWRERVIDIDILLYENEIITSQDLTIPHPQLPNRRFALVPLAEITGGLIHPLLQISIDDLVKQCPDSLEVIATGD